MKFLLRYFLLATFLAGAFSAYGTVFSRRAFAAGCTFSISPTIIAPHGDFTVNVQNLTIGVDYIIVYDASSFLTIWTANSTNFSATETPPEFQN